MAGENAGVRAMAAATQLEKIGFVDFTVDIVKGVYEVVVNASMDQLKAYADLVSKVAMSLSDYQKEIVGADDAEQEEKADSYIKEVLGFETAQSYSLTEDQAKGLKEHFAGVSVKEGEQTKTITDYITGEGTGSQISHEDLQTVVVEKLKQASEHSYNLLKTILKLGMQKVVVTNGEIRTKLTFHVDASDDYSKASSQYNNNTSGWGIGGGISGSSSGLVGKIFGGAINASLSGGYSSRKLSVSVVNERSSSATNVNVDIIGEVKLQFRTETFPSIEA